MALTLIANILLLSLEVRSDQITKSHELIRPLLAAEFSLKVPLSLLQVISFFIAWVVLWSPLAIVLAIALNWHPSKPLTVNQKLPLLASLYLIAPFIVWGSSQLAGSSLANYGFTLNLQLLSSVGIGLSWGVFSLAMLLGIQTALSWATWLIDKRRLISVLLPSLLLALWVSGTEELVFRGLLLTQLQQDYTTEIAAAISSVIFALLHLMWERQETIPQLPGLWLMGMVLVIARCVDGGLGLAWGLHAGWVWVIVLLDSAQLITYTGVSPEWVTGKNGKPLAGATGILCLLATGLLLWWFY